MEPTTQFSPRVLLAIDDLRLRRTNEAGFRAAGFAVSAPGDADAVSILAESFSPDVLVIDTVMQDANDRPLYQRLRNDTDGYLLCIESNGRDRAASNCCDSAPTMPCPCRSAPTRSSLAATPCCVDPARSGATGIRCNNR